LPEFTSTITHQGNTLTMVSSGSTITGTLNNDGSFTFTTTNGVLWRGVFATEGGRTVIRDSWQESQCEPHWAGTKQ
jgi:hypothetical protein